MEIWVDTIDEHTISLASELNILKGVTTNPRILSASPLSMKETIDKLLHIQDGNLAIQVTHKDAESMIKQALPIAGICERIMIKVPATKEGLKAIKLLTKEKVPTMATMIFHPNQVLLAAAAGAKYVAPYLSRMEKVEENGWEYLEAMSDIIAIHALPVKLLVASLKSNAQIMQCAHLGVDAITIKKDTFSHFIGDNKYTLDCEEEFIEEWQQSRHAEDPLFSGKK